MEFRSFDYQQELEAQRALFTECFPENLGTPVISNEHYLWKFHSANNNNGLRSEEYVASEDSSLLGYYAAIPYRYSYNNELLKVAMVCDVMTGVKARGKGIFTRLGVYSTDQMREKGFDFTTGYPIREEVIPGHIKAGWEKRFELPLYGKFIRFNSFLKNKRLGIFALPAKFCLGGYSLIKKIGRKKAGSDLSLAILDSREHDVGDLLAPFFETWKSEIPVALIKDKEFINWRLSAPEKTYKIILLKDNNSIVGVLIARKVIKENVPCYGILDLCLLKNYHKYAYLLIDKLELSAKESKIELILMMISQHWLDKYDLRKSVFLKTPYTFHFITKHFNPTVDKDTLYDYANWHLMWIDSDDL